MGCFGLFLFAYSTDIEPWIKAREDSRKVGNRLLEWRETRRMTYEGKKKAVIPSHDTPCAPDVSFFVGSVRDIKTEPFKYLVTVFPTLLYTSTREIPTLSYSSSLKKVPV